MKKLLSVILVLMILISSVIGTGMLSVSAAETIPDTFIADFSHKAPALPVR